MQMFIEGHLFGGVSRVVRATVVCGAALAFVFGGAAYADDAALTKGAAAYKPYAVRHIDDALAGAKELQAAVKAGDVKAAQAAWIKSRKGWEAAEPITGEFFSDLDEAIDAWPDATKGYHAIEAALFSGKLNEIGAPVDELVSNLSEFSKKLGDASFNFTPQGLLNGTTGLAYEVGENKSKGGESPHAGTSVVDMHENVEGIEAAYHLAFEEALKAKDPKLAKQIDAQIEKVEDLVKVKTLKELNQPKLSKAAEELAVLMQSSAAPLGLEKPTLGD
jgi:iron uptake system EfeUOB component EfeO/EfeM